MPYYFTLPIITELTIGQQIAVNEPLPIALSGGPGTGKSVVCLWRHIQNYNANLGESLLLTYTKTLEHYLKQSASNYSSIAAENIDRTMWWTTHNRKDYEEIIIDEGQDVSTEKYKIISSHTEAVCFGADDAQGLYRNGCKFQEIKEMFPSTESYTLSKNFRNSKEILLFIKSVFPNTLIPTQVISESKSTGLKPILKVVGWNDDLEIKHIVNIINTFHSSTHNIGILLPTINKVDEYFKKISSRLSSEKSCSKFQNTDENFTGMENIHITTFKSSKGVEFDTVIIPNFDSIDWWIENGREIKEADYYVALTRTKRNLFLTCKYMPKRGDSSTFEIER